MVKIGSAADDERVTNVHELAIAESVLDTITKRIGERSVREIRLEVGRLSGVSADALRFCFELAAADTTADGAALVIEEPPGRAHCVTCGEEFVVEDPILLCGCGSSDVRILAGEELRILSVEVVR
jgi:hydrogenase nickel incorporation protein HypA/HybF